MRKLYLFSFFAFSISLLSAQTFVKPNNQAIKFTGSHFNKMYDDSVIFRRHSDTFLALKDFSEALANDDNARTNTSITINFKTDADTIKAKFRMLSGANAYNLYTSYYVDGDSINTLKQKRDDLTNAGDSTFYFTIPSPTSGEHTYKLVLSTWSTVSFLGLDLIGGSESLVDFQMPSKPLYMAYGNSITHGRGQDVSDQTYPWKLAERMGWQLSNVAVGGSKTSVPMAEMITNEIPDSISYMTILIGYNDVVGYAQDTTYYRERLRSFIDTIRKGHPETVMFVLGQTYTTTTENKNGDPIDFDDVRKVQKFIVDSMTTAGDSMLFYINGENFTDSTTLNDVVHLSVYGADIFGNALADTIPQILSVKSIIVSGKDGVTEISEENGSLQMIAGVLPSYALNREVEWSVSDENIATINTEGLLTAKSTGMITVTAKAKDGSEVYGTTEITISGQTTISNDETELIKIFPNPAKELLTINLPYNMPADVSLYNIAGQRVPAEQSVKGNQVYINVSNLPQGIYLIKVGTVSQKIIISRD